MVGRGRWWAGQEGQRLQARKPPGRCRRRPNGAGHRGRRGRRRRVGGQPGGRPWPDAGAAGEQGIIIVCWEWWDGRWVVGSLGGRAPHGVGAPAGASARAPAPASTLPPSLPQRRVFTPDELALHDGTRGRGIYLAVLGEVYDVSAGRKHYGADGAYAHFAGRDASRSFITGKQGCFEGRWGSIVGFGCGWWLVCPRHAPSPALDRAWPARPRRPPARRLHGRPHRRHVRL